MKQILSAAGLLLLLAACSDEPLLNSAGIYSSGGKDLLIASESVYTVTQKKVSGGSTFRRGYTTMYLSSTDVATGEQLKKIKTGDFRERTEYIGMPGGVAWFFSYDKELGLHTRDARTLEVLKSAKDIVAANPALAAGFAEQGHQHGMDTSGRFIFCTTKDGYHYLIDPISLHAVKAEAGAKRRGILRTTGSMAQLNDSLEANFTGSGRKKLVIHRKRFDAAAYRFYSRNGSPVNASMYYRDAGSDTAAAVSFIEPEFMMDGDAAGDGSFGRQNIIKDGSHLFIISKSLLGNEFNWVIAALDLPYSGSSRVLWQYEVSGTARLSSSDREFLYGRVVNGRLVLVFKNAMLALDAAGGKLLWRKDYTREP